MTLDPDLGSRSSALTLFDHLMRLNGLYFGTKYEVCRWNSIRDMTHFLDFGQLLDIWPWPVTLTFDQGRWHLGHWMRLIGLYLGTKYDVCGSNRYWDMNPCLPDIQFDLEIWPLTLSQGQRKLHQLNSLFYHHTIWSGSVKWFRNYL